LPRFGKKLSESREGCGEGENFSENNSNNDLLAVLLDIHAHASEKVRVINRKQGGP
jgi:hypothetical protein